MLTWLKTVLATTGKRLWSGFLYRDAASYDAEIKLRFATAKILSDFAGMLGRLAFTIAFIQFLYAHLDQEKGFGWLEVALCLSAACMFAVYFGFNIMLVVLNYLMKDVTKPLSLIGKLIMAVNCFIFYLSVLHGITLAAFSLAKLTKVGQ